MYKMNVDVLEAVLEHIIDEETLGVCFEIHRAIKLQYYDVVNPDERYIYSMKSKFRGNLIIPPHFNTIVAQ